MLAGVGRRASGRIPITTRDDPIEVVSEEMPVRLVCVLDILDYPPTGRTIGTIRVYYLRDRRPRNRTKGRPTARRRIRTNRQREASKGTKPL